ncbi:MAG TPA: FtsX-like permease family protein [Sediminispirochaeta sp.]|nr:FtsX-like permease family protein [Sediminispirochaeta sp.]
MPALLSLALRNVVRNLRRLAPMMFSIVLIFALLVAGNAVLETTVESLYRLYARHITGDLSVSAKVDSNFTIFGSDQLLVGQYLVQPTLLDYPELKRRTEALPEVRAAAGLISSAARVKVGGRNRDVTVFGVDFDEYFRLVPDFQLTSGELPEPGQGGVIVSEGLWKDPVGKKALLASSTGRHFTLREVPVTGTIDYPVRDEILDNLVLVDADTARALNGYLYGAQDAQLLSPEEQEALTGDIGALFGDSGGDPFSTGAADDAVSTDSRAVVDDTAASAHDETAGADQPSAGEEDTIDPFAIFDDNSRSDSADTPAQTDSPPTGDPADPKSQTNSNSQTDSTPRIDSAERTDQSDGDPALASAPSEVDSGAWNFLLVSLRDRGAAEGVVSSLEETGFRDQTGYLIRDWSRSVGGNAMLARYLQLLFNLGLLFVSFGAVIIAANALLLSILERTREIGTLRALGAGRARVALLIGLETLIVVFGSALAGILLGFFGVQWLNEAGIVIENRYIQLLFGGEPLRGNMSGQIVLNHLFAGLLLAALSMLYPLKRALEISPVEAMAE